MRNHWYLGDCARATGNEYGSKERKDKRTHNNLCVQESWVRGTNVYFCIGGLYSHVDMFLHVKKSLKHPNRELWNSSGEVSRGTYAIDAPECGVTILTWTCVRALGGASGWICDIGRIGSCCRGCCSGCCSGCCWYWFSVYTGALEYWPCILTVSCRWR